ncbi:helix-turn-helix domain-containing protein [Enterococcus raffinosus]|uniref:helix-turn-helix domain-containing protein n=1 Tax=Enterococcus raffinosus TaxID=71452 RepID=UPI001C49639A|nr:helix-turn-helix domain-containing protein [Enterococcus raffinosus]QXJ60502.1 helix-turn-helix domain-containing protein [Enterococcus raffinosus]
MLTSNNIYFKIQEVAKILEVVPATIRNWEQNGFFTAKRSENGYRIFDQHDIEMLMKIKNWSVDMKMGTQAVKMMVDSYSLNEANPSEENALTKSFLSEKWKESRQAQSKTIKEVADAVGISTSYLSKIENMQVNPSIEVLKKIADYYGENVLYYISTDPEETSQLVKKEHRVQIIDEEGGLSIENLLNQNNSRLSFMLYTLQPGSKRPTLQPHPGNEIVFVLSGKVTFTIGEKTVYYLEEGDCLSYSSKENHSWCNESQEETQLLWFYERIA